MNDIGFILQFLVAIEIIGLSGFPVSRAIFSRLPDQGWALAKIISILVIGWLMWLTSSLHILPFRIESLLLITSIWTVINWVFIFRLSQEQFKLPNNAITNSIRNIQRASLKTTLLFIAVEELILISGFIGWSYLRSFAPDINGLEKFMDYGFMLSIIRTDYFPPLDHFLAGETINYYYFGHYLAAMLTIIARVPATIGYNLQMSLILGLVFIESFILAAGLFFIRFKTEILRLPWRSLLAGGLATIFVGLIGNLHTIFYLPNEVDSYWYPNATRFIENTIHEYPIYSFIVNDLHGHVSSIPIVILILSLLVVFFLRRIDDVTENQVYSNLFNLKHKHLTFAILGFLGLNIGATYATNAWDFAIYLVVSGIILWTTNAILFQKENKIAVADQTLLQNIFTQNKVVFHTALQSIFLLATAIIPFLPYWMTVSPISQGIGIVPLDGHSPLWQLLVLWGIQVTLALFFIFWVFRRQISQKTFGERLLQFFSNILNVRISIDHSKPMTKNNPPEEEKVAIGKIQLHPIHVFLVAVTLVGFTLIILPEIIYLRDIYPTHYRANTMFKFFYQAWIMLGIVCGYSLVALWMYFNQHKNIYSIMYKIISVLLIFSGLLYPAKAIEQGFMGLEKSTGSLDGTRYLYSRLPNDAAAIEWLNKNIPGQPVIAEAVGDSYTDYARVAANTGFQTVLGWPVHEWLWRGSYNKSMIPTTNVEQQTDTIDSVETRTADVMTLYQTDSAQVARELIQKYQIEYIYVGDFEREKYPELTESKLRELETTVVYDTNDTRIYQIDSSP